MIKINKMMATIGAATLMVSCTGTGQKTSGDFKYLIDEFADLKIMRYRIPGWDQLTLRQKEYVYHLGEAAKYGRDIIWMQNCEVNLPIRKAVETVIEAVAHNDPAMIYEASDLIYHLLVLLVDRGLSISDLEKELAKRHR